MPADMTIFRNFVSLLSDSKNNRYLASIVITSSLVLGVYFLGSAFTANNFKIPQRSEMELKDAGNNKISAECKKRCRSPGSEVWPEGIIAKTSDLDMRPLWGSVIDNNHSNRSGSLLAIAAGIKQKDLVNKIVTKFLEKGVAVMVFHYDGVVDQWNDLGWPSDVIHVCAVNQTKWWFAKRFLHPDIVAEYDYIFLWDEDLGVENFDPGRYLSIIKEEGLDISQPALDPAKSEIHHQITIRRRNSKVHRSYTKYKGGGRCYANSTGPPCLGWVEMMAPVFSKAAWRCAWELIQNDLIHAWGIDFQLGYCAQGDRKKRVGVVDAEYVVHLGVPTLGGSGHANNESLANHVNMKNVTTDSDDFTAPPDNTDFHTGDDRSEIRRQSYIEMRIFWNRWYKAVKDDKCWVDRYKTKKKKKCILGPCRLENTNTTSQNHRVNIHP